jgi:drug/metabolite transporter (DMT)-like permease
VAPYEIAILAAFGFTTICAAFLLFMEGAKHIPAAEAGLISMLDVVLGPLWVFLGFGERPGMLAIAGGVLVIGALLWRLAPDPPRLNVSLIPELEKIIRRTAAQSPRARDAPRGRWRRRTR